MGVPPLLRALLFSVTLHAGLGAVAVRSALGGPPRALVVARDVWSGEAIEVESAELLGPVSDSPRKSSESTSPDPESVENTTKSARLSAPSPAPQDPPRNGPEPQDPPRNGPEPALTPPPRKSSERPEGAEGERPKPTPSRERPRASASGATPPGPQADPPASATTSTAADGVAARASGAFGAPGLPRGVRHLAYAVTRAFPPASSGDPGWLELAPGEAGEVEIVLSVDRDGKLGELGYPRPEAARRQPAAVRHAVERIVLLLRSGVFSLSPDAIVHGEQRLRLTFHVSDEHAGKGVDSWQHSFRPPRGKQPGNSAFVTSSGRRVEARVWLVP